MRYLLDTNICLYIAKQRPPEVLAQFKKLAQAIPVLALDEEVSHHYGEIRAKLHTSGTPIGNHDALIAAHSRSQQLILVTNHQREFDRAADLTIENWAKN